jgi:hypothetical protein
MFKSPIRLHGRMVSGGDYSQKQLIISIIVVIVLPIYNMVFVYPSITHLFAKSSSHDATNIAKQFMSIFENRPGNLDEDLSDPHLVKDIGTLKDIFGLSKLKVFSKSGEILFSTDSKETGNINTETYFHDIVSQGKIYTKVVKNNTESLEHEIISGDVVETYVPLMKEGVFQGAFEIYYDITDKKHDFDRLLLISFVISIVLAVGVLLTSLMNVVKERRMSIERKRAQDERERLIAELRGALAQVKTLNGLLPICASCKKIRDDQGYWNQLEDYISSHSSATFSHGICPGCAKKLYPEYFKHK